MPERDMPFNVIRRAPQTAYPLHCHDFSELVIVYGGEGIHFSEFYSHRIKSGDVFVVNASSIHGYKETKALHLVNILFLPGSLSAPLFDLPLKPAFHMLFTLEPEYRDSGVDSGGLHLNDKQLAEVMALVDKMENEIREQQVGCRTFAAGCFMQLAVMLTRCYDVPRHVIPEKMMKISEILAYLNRYYRSELNMSDLCSGHGMSESTLTRSFKQATGVTVYSYCLKLRLRHASMLLKNTDLSISEIAVAVGFEDSNYFSRAFKRSYGLTPREHRALS